MAMFMAIRHRGHNPKGDPVKGYDGRKDLNSLTCGVGRGC